jgi:predicted GNAT family N-acyltransferase
MTLHARESALPFYAKLGYQRVGSRFLEIQLPHWEMRKSL